MKNFAEEYFYMLSVGANYPLLNITYSKDQSMLYKKYALDENHRILFKFGDPIPPKPQLADVHDSGYHLIISDKIKEVMQGMQLKEIQFLPATIRNPKTDEVFENYWALHIYNMVHCFDKENSEFDIDEDDGSIVSIEKLVFDNEALEKIPLEERLVFALGEKRLHMFFHASVVEKIIALKPKGMMFCPLEKWSESVPFELAAMEYIIDPEED